MIKRRGYKTITTDNCTTLIFKKVRFINFFSIISIFIFILALFSFINTDWLSGLVLLLCALLSMYIFEFFFYPIFSYDYKITFDSSGITVQGKLFKYSGISNIGFVWGGKDIAFRYYDERPTMLSNYDGDQRLLTNNIERLIKQYSK